MNVLSRQAHLHYINRGVSIKLAYIAVLNFLDGILTHVEITRNITSEANVLLSSIMPDFYKMCLYKLAIPSLVLLLIYLTTFKADYSRMPAACASITICLLAYLSVLLLHLGGMGICYVNYLMQHISISGLIGFYIF